MNDELLDELDVGEPLRRVFKAERSRRKQLEKRVSELEDQQETSDTRLRNHDERLNDLEHQYETLAGLADDEETAAAARRRDCLLAMKRQAEKHADDGKPATCTLDYSGIRDHLTTLGHEDLYDQQLFRVMDQLDERFECIQATTLHGNQAIRFVLEKFELGDEGHSNDVRSRAKGATDSRTKQTSETSQEIIRNA